MPTNSGMFPPWPLAGEENVASQVENDLGDLIPPYCYCGNICLIGFAPGSQRFFWRCSRADRATWCHILMKKFLGWVNHDDARMVLQLGLTSLGDRANVFRLGFPRPSGLPCVPTGPMANSLRGTVVEEVHPTLHEETAVLIEGILTSGIWMPCDGAGSMGCRRKGEVRCQFGGNQCQRLLCADHQFDCDLCGLHPLCYGHRRHGEGRPCRFGVATSPPPTRREGQPHARPLKNRMQRNRVGQMVEVSDKGGGVTLRGPSSAGWAGVATS